MKRYILITMLMTIFVPATALCLEPDEAAELENMEHQLRLRKKQLQLEDRETKLQFQRKMQDIKLEERRGALARQRKTRKHPTCFRRCRKGVMLPFLVVCFVVHILLAVWVFQDIRKRNAGSGIWIVITLLTGLFGALVYAVVRLGDTKQSAK